MLAYLNLLRDVVHNGVPKKDRTGVGTIGVFGCQVRYDLKAGFPLLTTKAIHWHSVVHELIWFLRGDTNIAYLNNNNVRIWDEWADEKGDLGPIYGHQWRSWKTADGHCVDQIKGVIESIRSAPYSRRHLVSAWNVGDLQDMALPPCHLLFQFHVTGKQLSCQIYQRSADLFLGVPFNVASYALLTHLIAHVCHLEVGELIHTFGDLHIYQNHQQQVAEQLSRNPRPLPAVAINPDYKDDTLRCLRCEDISLSGYYPHPAIYAPIAV